MRSRWSGAIAAGFIGAALLLAMPGSGLADELTGTWTGRFKLRGNYYWETSTRVVAPAIGLDLVSPEGTSVGGTYLVDSITSASQAAGATEDVRFTEIRHDFTLNVGRELELDSSTIDALQLASYVHFSREPDYTSISGGLSAALFFNDRSTTLNLSLAYLHDEVRRRFRGPPPADTGTGLGGRFAPDFDALSLGVGVDQILTPVLVAELRYDYVYLNGYLANAYRRVLVAGAAVPENHPGIRHRHTLSARLKYYVPATRTAFQLRYRAYVDSWDVAALNPEFRVYQPIAEFLTLRLRYRYYRQRRSYFYQDDQQDYTAEDRIVTADPKMSSFRSHELGLLFRLDLSFLEESALGFLAEAVVDLSFNYMWRTSSFGMRSSRRSA